jgi:hypothetical protein
MTQTITANKRFDFKDLPTGWQVTTLSLDWNGEPLLFVLEGKPPAPPRTDSPTWFDSYVAWMNIPPKAHHVLTFENERPHTITFESSTGVITSHVQRFGDGWLLADGRGGEADVYNAGGKRGKTLDLGDASEDVQTTRDGHIWVSYFDEGVFGSGIGSAGLVCFDSSGKPIFRYADLADQRDLPSIDDCYALNVVDDNEVWLCYYSDFPLVKLKNFTLDAIWKDFGSIDHGFAVRDEAVIFKRAYNRINERPDQLFRYSLKGDSQPEPLNVRDQDGSELPQFFDVFARGPSMYLKTADAFYEMLRSN